LRAEEGFVRKKSLIIVFAMACGEQTVVESESEAKPVTVVPEPVPTVKPAVEVVAKTQPEPLKGKTAHDMCDRSDESLLLIKYSVETLMAGGWKKACCEGEKPARTDGICELDWPSSDVPDCSMWDDLRNGIYARYGYTFSSQAWKDRFEKEGWYQPRADFDESWLSDTARANVAVLKKYAADKFMCMDFPE